MKRKRAARLFFTDGLAGVLFNICSSKRLSTLKDRGVRVPPMLQPLVDKGDSYNSPEKHKHPVVTQLSSGEVKALAQTLYDILSYPWATGMRWKELISGVRTLADGLSKDGDYLNRCPMSMTAASSS